MKKQPALFVFFFFGILALCAVLTFCLPQRSFSDNENRTLATMPALSWETVKDGSFQKDFTDFLSDQVPGREFWVQANTVIKRLTGRQEINGVYFGKDGYYFQQFTEDSYSHSDAPARFALLQKFAENAGVPVYLMPVPTPATVLTEKLPANAPVYDADGVWELCREQTPDCRFIDLRERFAGAQGQIYYRTDHHWTAWGAYEAYLAYCNAAGLEAKPLADFGLEQMSDRFYGTLYSKVLAPDAQPDLIYAPQALPQVQVRFDGAEESDSVYQPDFLEKKDKYAYFFGGNWGEVEIRTRTENGKHLLVIKDSFANSLVPYLLESYETVTMIDLRYYGGSLRDLLRERGITEVLVLYEMTNLLTDGKLVRISQ